MSSNDSNMLVRRLERIQQHLTGNLKQHRRQSLINTDPIIEVCKERKIACCYLDRTLGVSRLSDNTNSSAQCQEKKLSCFLEDMTTYKIGGPAEMVAYPASKEDIISLIKCCRDNDIPWLPVGLGSNILFTDDGYHGLIINTSHSCRSVSWDKENGKIQADAGLSLEELSIFGLYNNIPGLDFCEGIPGTVGGAVYINAYAYDRSIGELVEKVEYVDHNGECKPITSKDIGFASKYSIFQAHPDWIITSVTLNMNKPLEEMANQLKTGDDFDRFKMIFGSTKKNIRKRAVFQPPLEPELSKNNKSGEAGPSGGSVFKGLGSEYVAELYNSMYLLNEPKYRHLQECLDAEFQRSTEYGMNTDKQINTVRDSGLVFIEKNLIRVVNENLHHSTRSLGGALVSPKHSNFIINKNKAQWYDVVGLIESIRYDVYVQFGIVMRPEIELILPDGSHYNYVEEPGAWDEITVS